MKSTGADDSTPGAGDHLLWEMGRRVPCRQAPGPSGEQLESYRAGRSGDEEATTIEVALAHAPESRARLATLGLGAPASPAPAARARALAAFDAEWRPTWGGEAPWMKMRRILQAAAVVVVGLGVLLLLRDQLALRLALPDGLDYDVEAEGLAQMRGPIQGSSHVAAYPETLVRITASPRPVAEEGIEFGLYRLDHQVRLVHLPFGAAVALEEVRGAARIAARADDLLAPGATTARLFLVVARPGDLPADLDLASGEDAASDARLVLEAGGRRRVYPLDVRLEPRSSSRKEELVR